MCCKWTGDERLSHSYSFRTVVWNTWQDPWGSLAITKCWAKVRQSVWWPGILKELEQKVENCYECSVLQVSKQKGSPDVTISLTRLTMAKSGYRFILIRSTSKYLLIVDYYSRCIEILKLSQLTWLKLWPVVIVYHFRDTVSCKN